MKKFIIIGNKNAPASVTIFPLFKDKTIRFGYTKPFFQGLQGLTRWITTMPVNGGKPLILTAKYDPDKYPKYDNYNAINVNRIKDIPGDYYDAIGVPVTIFDYDIDDIQIEGILAGEYTTIGDNYVLEHLPRINGKKKYSRIIILGKGGDLNWAEKCDFFTPPSIEESEKYKKQNSTFRIQNPYLSKEGKIKTEYNRIFIKIC